MRTVEHAPLAKQPHANAGSLPLADFRAQLGKQRLDVPPRYVRADGMAEYQGKCSSMLALHETYGTVNWYQASTSVPHQRCARLDALEKAANQFMENLDLLLASGTVSQRRELTSITSPRSLPIASWPERRDGSLGATPIRVETGLRVTGRLAGVPLREAKR